MTLWHRLTFGVIAVLLCSASSGQTTNPITAPLPQSDIRLQLEDVIRIPNFSGSTRPRLELLTHAGDGSGRLYVADQLGKIYSFTPGDQAASLFLNVSQFAPGFLNTGGQRGLRSFAFHPDFLNEESSGYRKLYTAHSTTTNGSGNHDSVVSEWTLRANGSVNTSIAPRELLRVEQPRADHNIGRIAFNPNAHQGASDHGLLYIALGDGGNYRTPGDSTLNPNGQDPSNLFGSILRIDPAVPDAATGLEYSIPSDNPFVDVSGYRPELWAYGLRNPHQFSWDTQGDRAMLIADIGQSNIEEINLGVAGANYGWSVREGTFSVEGKAPFNTMPIQLDPLPASHPTDPYTYPVAQYDHDQGGDGNEIGNSAIAGGFVYRGTRVSELFGKYIFGDFANNDGPIYLVDASQLDQQHDFTDLASQDGGSLAPIEELVLLDDKGTATTFLDLIRAASGNSSLGRTDLRFGGDADGEVYVLNKHDGWIRRFVGTPGLPGDYNDDGLVDLADYTVWRDSLGASAGALDNDFVGGVIGRSQYAQWRDNFRRSLTTTSSIARTSVPEPPSRHAPIVLLLLSLVSASRHRCRAPAAGNAKLPAARAYPLPS